MYTIILDYAVVPSQNSYFEKSIAFNSGRYKHRYFLYSWIHALLITQYKYQQDAAL